VSSCESLLVQIGIESLKARGRRCDRHRSRAVLHSFDAQWAESSGNASTTMLGSSFNK
jgi:hypothetical protein